MKNGEEFLAKWHYALDAYFENRGLRKSEMARFRRVADRCCDCDAVEKVKPATAVRKLVMDREGNVVEDEEFESGPVIVPVATPVVMNLGVSVNNNLGMPNTVYQGRDPDDPYLHDTEENKKVGNYEYEKEPLKRDETGKPKKKKSSKRKKSKKSSSKRRLKQEEDEHTEGGSERLPEENHKRVEESDKEDEGFWDDDDH